MINPTIIRIILLSVMITTRCINALAGTSVPSIHSVPQIANSKYIEIPVMQINASSELRHQDSAGVLMQYTANNLLDTLSNAWVEGARGYGKSETVSFLLDAHEYPHVLGIVNGYAKSTKTWRENTRVKKLLLSCNDTAVAVLMVKDTWEWQYFHLSEILHSRSEPAQYTLRIEDVYRGLKFKDAAISRVLLLKKADNAPIVNSQLPINKIMLFVIPFFIIVPVFMLIRKRLGRRNQSSERKQAKDLVLYQLQLFSDLVKDKFEHEIALFCRSSRIPEEKRNHIFTVLKFAQQHQDLRHVCNYDVLHEIRQFRNRLAHPDREYHHESLESLVHYQKVLSAELSRLKAHLKD